MGNVVSDNNYNLKNYVINDFITNWAKEHFDNGLNYNDDNIRYKYEFLRKRACCTRNNIMKIALPEINNNDVATNFNYVPVNIVLSEMLTQDSYGTCLMAENQSSSNNSKQDYLYNFDSNKQMTPACVRLYGGGKDTDSYNFCELVAIENRLMFSDANEIHYGKYGVTNKKGKEAAYYDNVFVDCNCENSIMREEQYKLLKLSIENQGKGHNMYDPDIMAQLLDVQCSGTTNNAYRRELHDTPGCIQNINLENVEITLKNTNLTIGNMCHESVDDIDDPPKYVIPQKADELPNNDSRIVEIQYKVSETSIYKNSIIIVSVTSVVILILIILFNL